MADLRSFSVLIETLWNVKCGTWVSAAWEFQVLIETLWNVKPVLPDADQEAGCGFNRNIVECKDYSQRQTFLLISVLIETLWNVKEFDFILCGNIVQVLIETLWNVKI